MITLKGCGLFVLRVVCGVWLGWSCDSFWRLSFDGFIGICAGIGGWRYGLALGFVIHGLLVVRMIFILLFGFGFIEHSAVCADSCLIPTCDEFSSDSESYYLSPSLASHADSYYSSSSHDISSYFSNTV